MVQPRILVKTVIFDKQFSTEYPLVAQLDFDTTNKEKICTDGTKRFSNSSPGSRRGQVPPEEGINAI